MRFSRYGTQLVLFSSISCYKELQVISDHIAYSRFGFCFRTHSVSPLRLRREQSCSERTTFLRQISCFSSAQLSTIVFNMRSVAYLFSTHQIVQITVELIQLYTCEYRAEMHSMAKQPTLCNYNVPKCGDTVLACSPCCTHVIRDLASQQIQPQLLECTMLGCIRS